MSPHNVRFSTLLYRYFFFGWMFRDLDSCQDNLFQRAAAERHNRRQAAWLPTYMLRWLTVGVLLYGLAGALEMAFGECTSATCLYGACMLCVSGAVAIGVAWLGITRLRDCS